MSAKRKLSGQQKGRIRAAQASASSSDRHQNGRVISHHGRLVLVELDAGGSAECKIKTNLGAIVCGDRVTIETTERDEKRLIGIIPRDNLLQRMDGFGQVRYVAANISQLVVCLSINPPPNLFLLDQYLLSAEQQGIDAIILLNKIDMDPAAADPFELKRIYAPLGYEIVATSIKTGAGMARFTELLRDQVSVLSGVSGVGKSSLTAYLLPEQVIKIAAISEANDEGRHTTRTSRLYRLANGGDLIDTPGVRGFSPFVDREAPLAAGFREIADHGDKCRFNNCRHLNEPNCAVIDAVDCGAITRGRYQNYLKLLEQRD